MKANTDNVLPVLMHISFDCCIILLLFMMILPLHPPRLIVMLSCTPASFSFSLHLVDLAEKDGDVRAMVEPDGCPVLGPGPVDSDAQVEIHRFHQNSHHAWQRMCLRLQRAQHRHQVGLYSVGLGPGFQL